MDFIPIHKSLDLQSCKLRMSDGSYRLSILQSGMSRIAEAM